MKMYWGRVRGDLAIFGGNSVTKFTKNSYKVVHIDDQNLMSNRHMNNSRYGD
jgi:hypothetical protein